MKLNRDQIVKALECQVGTDEKHDCRGCYFYKEGGLCSENMSEGIATVALALIRELTIELDAMRGAANSYKMDNQRLIEENERLNSINKALVKNNSELETELAQTYDLLEKAKADTVRKMQKKIKAKILEINHNLCGLLPFIDQIAKELLEEGT